MMEEIKYRPVGVVHSPHKTPKGTPIQPSAAIGLEAVIEIFPEFAAGLKDLESFSHLIIIYDFHKAGKSDLLVKPYMDSHAHGVFATRAPGRPNSIGLSVVRLSSVEGNKLHILDVDMLDKTPVLDIKPLVPEFDFRKVEKIGWLEKNVDKLPDSRDDGRFQ
jgi:tRNA-Thr(GGU) m(6)t(6)A37 methyltransferase TsaA